MHPGLLIGAGFLLGTAGVKAVTSKPAKKAYVKGLVAGMKVRDDAAALVDDAKAEFDDLMAEAGYEKKQDTDDDQAEAEVEDPKEDKKDEKKSK